MWRFAQILTKASIKYLGASEREWADCDEALADALVEDILAGGNFGRKDASRSVQTMLISDRGKDGVGRTSVWREFLRSGNEVVSHHWPRAREWRVLLPVGWAYFGIRRVIREAVGKRPRTDARGVVGGAIARRDLYRRFGLFERE